MDYHFHLFWQCAWREKCIFASFFYNFRSGGFTVTIFTSFFIPFFVSFCLFLCQIHKNEPKMPKMSLKMSWKWPKNGYREPTVSDAVIGFYTTYVGHFVPDKQLQCFFFVDRVYFERLSRDDNYARRHLDPNVFTIMDCIHNFGTRLLVDFFWLLRLPVGNCNYY